jgi:hypothetical protein
MPLLVAALAAMALDVCVGFGPRRPDYLLLREAASFHCPFLSQATDSTSNWRSFRGAGQRDSAP